VRRDSAARQRCRGGGISISVMITESAVSSR
jgi:hypothetical protein